MVYGSVFSCFLCDWIGHQYLMDAQLEVNNTFGSYLYF